LPLSCSFPTAEMPMSGSKVSSDQQHQVTELHQETIVKEPRSYARPMRPKNSGQGEFPTPSSDSPFYMPPPSSKALRWSIVLCFIGPFVLASAAFEFARAHDWIGLAIALVMLSAYSLLEWIRIRAILRALARRRTGTGSGNRTMADDEAVEAARRQKAAWARVRHDVFPILSNPSVLKRPFSTWDDWKD
jgi:hypothetical protein